MLQFIPDDLKSFKEKALNQVSRFSPFVFLDSCGYDDPYGKYEWIAAAGAVDTIREFRKLEKCKEDGWLFGHLSYEAHRQMGAFNDVLAPAGIAFPEIHFFEPEWVVFQKRNSPEVSIHSAVYAPSEIYQSILAETLELKPIPQAVFKRAFEKKAYCEIIEKLRTHIREGDCYEINFCNAREGTFPEAPDPVSIFRALRQSSSAPFAGCYGVDDHWLVSASPERYLALNKDQLISQPIKGTAPRFADLVTDKASRKQLQESRKEQAENVMIVDLTRSDLAKVCTVGSVQVEELFGIQSFPQVHQMVSTISGKLATGKTLWDGIKNSFPMGSMTGAPRQKVMDLIRKYEQQVRSFFSGSLGFVDPDGHADFNVVIRSVWGSDKQLYFNTGGAITWNSTPEGEWEECLLKGKAIENLFGPSGME